LFYSLYCKTVESDVSLCKFGIDKIQNPTQDIITLEFVHETKDLSDDYSNHQTSCSEKYGYYFVEGIALFEIFLGKKIVIRFFNDIDDDLVHILLNYPFAMLFNQRKQFAIHASSVIFNDKVFCFCGPTQSGKSSLVSHLLKMGGTLTSEDTCIFDNHEGDLKLLPSYSFIKISDKINAFKKDSFENPITFLKKSTNRKGYIIDKSRFSSKPVLVNYFIYLHWNKGPSVLEELSNETSLSLLLSNEFISYSRESALPRFKAAAKIISQSHHFKYTRERKLKTLDDFLNSFSERF
tara:strand:+ start:1787 stop:2668 length:882 start_codon:yes stop_codon:yes gene_type:complete